MVVVFLKNGEKAPLPDANFVKIEEPTDGRGLMLRCLYGEREVGQFKWEDVAGYSIDIPPEGHGVSSASAYQTWGVRSDL